MNIGTGGKRNSSAPAHAPLTPFPFFLSSVCTHADCAQTCSVLHVVHSERCIVGHVLAVCLLLVCACSVVY
jgi:hypothetical protein